MQPKYRRPLNNYQLSILNTLYKFRFTTASLLAQNQNAHHVRVISDRLKILVDQEYIGMNYDSSYKIKGQAATYYLLPKGVRYLRQHPYIQESALRSIYHDKRATPSVIAHRLSVFEVFIHFKNTYLKRFKFFSKTELMNKSYVPKAKPDALILDTQTNQHYFMDYLEDSASFWALRKTIKRYIAYTELGIWQKHKPGTPHPHVLLICQSSKTKKSAQNIAAKELDCSYVELTIRVAMLENLKEISPDTVI
jgi:hypothetical protein